MSSAGTPAPAELAELSQEQREVAWARWQVLASTVQDAAPLTRSARAAGVPVRTAQRWLRDYRENKRLKKFLERSGMNEDDKSDQP